MEVPVTPFHAVWLDALRRVTRDGHVTAPRGKQVLEQLGFKVRFDALTALLVHPTRALNYRFAVAEWLWIVSGSDRLAPLVRYNSRMAEFSDDGETLRGAYGPRLLPQWRYVLEKLREDPDTRQAVAQIWTPSPAPSRDVPCTLSAQFLARGGRLHGLWRMRSSDLWLGLPYDAFSFARLTASVAGALNLRAGFVEIDAGSSHLYEEHWSHAAEVLERARDARSVFLDPLPGFPPLGVEYLVEHGRRGSRDQDFGLLAARWHDRPWSVYAEVLESRTSAVALELLERAGRKEAA